MITVFQYNNKKIGGIEMTNIVIERNDATVAINPVEREVYVQGKPLAVHVHSMLHMAWKYNDIFRDMDFPYKLIQTNRGMEYKAVNDWSTTGKVRGKRVMKYTKTYAKGIEHAEK